MTNKRNGTIYTGVTSGLVCRVLQHKQGEIPGFTKKYNITRLVYFEEHDSIYEAILREKMIKKWNRKWKLSLIEKENPT
jgi:putative endonuclease